MEEKKQSYKALSKICLNNWHYIDHKVLSLNENINFFTGHSGSGKSTVIDALQIVLYANTDGRGFFNKAAADDSDRSLIEYLRGMVSIGENNDVEYLRNKNFSATIVIELTNTKTLDRDCVGIVFDVTTATNEINRMFFWHKGPLMDMLYRYKDRCMATSEVKEYLQRNFSKEECFFTSNNEHFRRNLYDIYLGGLDMEKFPRLFKRTIPFRMNIKLEDFVKEYICMEQDIHIEDMQESVMQYGRMRKKIEDTLTEIRELEDIRDTFEYYEEKQNLADSLTYRMKCLEMKELEQGLSELQDKIGQAKQEGELQEKLKAELEIRKHEITEMHLAIRQKINNSGYDQLEIKLLAVNEMLERLEKSKGRWQQIAEAVGQWKEQDITPNQTLWDIEKFQKGNISEGELSRLKNDLEEILEEIKEDLTSGKRELKEMREDLQRITEELKILRGGEKGYPKILEEARYELRNKLRERVGKFVNVHILADLLDVRNEEWHNAVEGYLGWNKLALIVEPKYVRDAFEIYEEMDKKRFWRVSIVDTLRVSKKEWEVKEHALAEEVTAKEDYAQSFVDFLLGKVIKCENVQELRRYRIAVTKDCLLYQNFQLRRMNPDNYTVHAYIGDSSLRQRIKRLDEERKARQNRMLPLEESLNQLRIVSNMQQLVLPVSEYVEMQKDMKDISTKQREKDTLMKQMEKLKEESVSVLKEEETRILEQEKSVNAEWDKLTADIHDKERDLSRCQEQILMDNEELVQMQREFTKDPDFEQEFHVFLEEKKDKTIDSMKNATVRRQNRVQEEVAEAHDKLIDIRTQYLTKYPNRNFSPSKKENTEYDGLLTEMQCDELEKFKEKAKEQAKSAVEHFKDDFIFKIRSAIKEAYQRRDELNRIINRLDFGKDKYQFRITKNKGPDGEYYKMFMDDSLEIDPSSLTNNMDRQMDIFSMEHEDQYGELMNDLINIFIPPDNATPEELEAAKRNMDKYADYRTYLSFDMEQIIQGEDRLTIGLSRMIKKNSGGEGQNPLYVALLASFAQAYKVGMPAKLQRYPSIRLVILDEAFSKMDAEKVASCIALIRGLGFQAIISATNDKIQNYLENVDKTFVYANPNKKSISIQEFEKKEFAELVAEEDAG
ncbi:MAG: SbcC/MukB-like Walker B domain-containing protein [Hespellia sp.]|nr:SbcC/MukB-like Walker B domain-containing protein [Hespellia sp.]